MDDKQLLAAIREIVQNEVNSLRDEVSSIGTEVTSIGRSTIRLEGLYKQVNVIAESQEHTNEKLDRLQASIDEIAPTVTALDILHQIQKERAEAK